MPLRSVTNARDAASPLINDSPTMSPARLMPWALLVLPPKVPSCSSVPERQNAASMSPSAVVTAPAMNRLPESASAWPKTFAPSGIGVRSTTANVGTALAVVAACPAFAAEATHSTATMAAATHRPTFVTRRTTIPPGSYRCGPILAILAPHLAVNRHGLLDCSGRRGWRASERPRTRVRESLCGPGGYRCDRSVSSRSRIAVRGTITVDTSRTTWSSPASFTPSARACLRSRSSASRWFLTMRSSVIGIRRYPINAVRRPRAPIPCHADAAAASRSRRLRIVARATPRRTPSPRAAMDVVRVLGERSSGAFFVVSWYRVLAWSSVGWLSSASSPSRARPASSASQFGDLSPPR